MSYKLNAVEHVLKSKNEKVTSDYGNRVHPVTNKKSFHYGIDIISGTGNKEIVAFADGKVSAIRNSINGHDDKYAGGNYVYIDHSNGYQTRYLHLVKNSMKVKVGDKVAKGQEIAIMGKTGQVTGVHLHFEIRKNKTAQNPKDYLLGTKKIGTEAQKPSGDTYYTYTIKRGDTLGKIAKKYNTTVNELAKINNIKDPNKIYAGKTLKIPVK